MTSANIYAPPVELQGATDGIIYRVEQWLVVRDGAQLPEFCPITNEATVPSDWRKTVRIAWSSPWLIPLIFINVIVLLIVLLIVQKKGKITYSMSKQARLIVRQRRSLGFLLLALFPLGMFISTLDPVPSGVAIVVGLAAIISLIVSIYFFMNSDTIKTAKYKDGWFFLKGCHPDFLSRFPVAPTSMEIY